MSDWQSAAISAAGSMGTSAINLQGSKKQQERAYKKNIQFWNMQNEYNTPTAQMTRLTDAGLNPNLIYGGSPSNAAGSAGDIPEVKPADFNFENPLKNITNFADLQQKGVQTDNLRKQTEVITQDAALRAAQVAGQLTKNASNQLEYDVASELKQNSIDYAKENLRRMEEQTLSMMLDNDFKDKSMKDRLKDIFYKASISKQGLKGAELDHAMKSYELELNKLGISKNDAWYWRILGINADKINNTINNLKK